MSMKPLKLMIPGPIQPDPAVLQAMGSPVQPHYGPAWTDFYNQTIDLIRQVMHTRADTFLMVGSGSSGIDACIGSALSTGEKILVGSNGFFGDRLTAVARGYGLQVATVDCPWGQALTAAHFEAAYKAHPDAVAVAMVHLETSTTIVNSVEEVARFCKQNGLLCIIDAVSSLGGVPFCMDDWGIDLVASASQKCLGAPPGLAPVAVSDNGWRMIDRNPDKGHGWYGDLRVWRQYALDWADWHPFPITMATNNVVALNTSLNQLLAEGIETRLERYRKLALHLRAGLRRLGMEPYTPDEIMAPVLTAAYGPQGVPTSQIVHYMECEHDLKISGGLGALKDKIFRIGHMSPVLTMDDIDDLIERLSQFKA